MFVVLFAEILPIDVTREQVTALKDLLSKHKGSLKTLVLNDLFPSEARDLATNIIWPRIIECKALKELEITAPWQLASSDVRMLLSQLAALESASFRCRQTTAPAVCAAILVSSSCASLTSLELAATDVSGDQHSDIFYALLENRTLTSFTLLYTPHWRHDMNESSSKALAKCLRGNKRLRKFHCS